MQKQQKTEKNKQKRNTFSTTYKKKLQYKNIDKTKKTKKKSIRAIQFCKKSKIAGTDGRLLRKPKNLKKNT